MEKKQNNLDQLKGKNPFKVPEGYIDGLTSQIMSQLPEKSVQEEVKTVSMMDRIRPLLYMAAVFAGLLLGFKAFFYVTESDADSTHSDSLLVHTTIKTENQDMLFDEDYDEDIEYMEYIENQYATYILAAETTLSE